MLEEVLPVGCREIFESQDFLTSQAGTLHDAFVLEFVGCDDGAT